jgi:hypothetical protein
MAATAYICLVREDFNDDGLQVLDLKPNVSQHGIYDPPGQTAYISFYVQSDVVATTTAAGVTTTNAVYRGLAAYLIDNVENGVAAITAAQANAISLLLRTRMAAGLSMTAANVIATMAVVGVVNGVDSTWTLANILKICQGATYRLPAGSVVAVGGAFVVPHVPHGVFAAPIDADYVAQRQFEMTGFLLLSANQGILSYLKSPDFVWQNPSLTYGAAGTALMINGAHIPVTGAARVVVIYDAFGNVI